MANCLIKLSRQSMLRAPSATTEPTNRPILKKSVLLLRRQKEYFNGGVIQLSSLFTAVIAFYIVFHLIRRLILCATRDS